MEKQINAILTAKSVPLRIWEDVAGGIFFFFLNSHNLSSSSVTSVVDFNMGDCSPPGSSVHEILQARILEWIAMPSSRASSQTGDQTCVSCVSCITGSFFTHPSHRGSPKSKYHKGILFWVKLLKKKSFFFLLEKKAVHENGTPTG